MKITLKHPASRHGRPVILSDSGEVMAWPEGLKAACKRIGWSRARLAEEAGLKNAPCLHRYFQGRAIPPAHVLNVLGVELERWEQARGIVAALRREGS